MASTSNHANIANRQTILDALFTGAYLAAPISHLCAHTEPDPFGLPRRCQRTLPAASLQFAIDNIHQLHLHIPTNATLATLNHKSFTWFEMDRHLYHLSCCILCDEHRTADGHKLMKELLVDALTKSGVAAVKDAEARLKMATNIYIGPIYTQINKQRQNNRATKASDNPDPTFRPKKPNPFPSDYSKPEPEARKPSSDNKPTDPFTFDYDKPKPKSAPHTSWSDNKPTDPFPNAYIPGTHPRAQDWHFPPADPPPYESIAKGPIDKWLYKIRAYHAAWASKDPISLGIRDHEAPALIDRLHFPVYSGFATDVTTFKIRLFYNKMALYEPNKALEILKAERTRWHPDKMDQRFADEEGLEFVKEKANLICGVLNDQIKEMREK
ncbi:hypothetical protein KVT40_007478 [Elsinoe batatas]|uniref:Uncharacterized protein n=1 Tax=Elsinoe batatas TaxID=2601811 RepID=A0A8K0KYN5_9PEZI|nr:hypothetical protein KVT40_007478 [Elsinoe batatas]